MSAVKRCSTCKATKPVTAFYRDRRSSDGWQSHCKDCQKARMVTIRATRAANGLCIDGCGEPAVGKSSCRECLDARYTVQLLHRYGLTPAQYEEMLAEQGFACKICRRTEPRGHGRWHVDHDHACCPGDRSCGECVRGLLCHGCNAGLGMFNDSPAALVAAAEYLTSFSARVIGASAGYRPIPLMTAPIH